MPGSAESPSAPLQPRLPPPTSFRATLRLGKLGALRSGGELFLLGVAVVPLVVLQLL
jgi:hypothetical protein